MPDPGTFNYQHAATLKAALALAATGLLGWLWLTRSSLSPRTSSRADRALALLGIFSFVGWWNFGAFGFGGGFFHYHEFFHYYLGSKYSNELGYTGLYECVAAAEVEQGRASEVGTRWIRDLTSNELRPGYELLEGPPLCRGRFASPERWLEFKHDVAWFRDRLGADKWASVQIDHGYNATPVWTLAGRALANTGPVSHAQLFVLWWADPILLVGMWALVWWAFGWRVMCVALIWWGTNYPARYSFTGGAFLRQDWLFLAVAALCFAKRGRMALSGFALMWSVLLRVFPALIFLGLFLKVAGDFWRTRRIAAQDWRFAGGAALALIVLLPLSMTVKSEGAAGLDPWRGFVHNSQKHLATPLTNHVGLPVVVAFSPSGRSELLEGYWLDGPWDIWKETRRRVFEERRLVYWAVVTGFVALLAIAVQGSQPWAALTLGIGAIPIFTELTCYYYGILLGYAFLWPRLQVAGAGLAATSLISGLVTAVLRADDDRFTVISLSIVVFVLTVTAIFYRQKSKSKLNERTEPALLRAESSRTAVDGS